MKLLVAVFSLLLLHNPKDPLLVVDKDLKKPIGQTQKFTTDLYLQRSFPVYASDVEAVIDATDRVVKALDKEQECEQTIRISTAHTTFVIDILCRETRKINVTLITQIEETDTSFSFALVRNNQDTRKVQQKLLDFAAYLNK